MYLGFTLALTGRASLLDHPVSLVAPIGFFVAAHRWYIPFEEAHMTETFGPEYESYCRTVRRWIGRR